MDDPIAVIRACAQAMRIFDRPETAAEVDRAADELERLRAAQPANQCDGCARNLPVEDGRHVDRFGMPVMACQAHRYSKPAQPAVPEDRLMQQFDSWWEQHGEYLRAGGGNYERTFAWHAWRESAKQASPAQPAVPDDAVRLALVWRVATGRESDEERATLGNVSPDARYEEFIAGIDAAILAASQRKEGA